MKRDEKRWNSYWVQITGFQNRWLRKLVTSSTWSPTMTQQSLSVLCFATSSALTDMLSRVGCGKSGHQIELQTWAKMIKMSPELLALKACFTLGTATYAWHPETLVPMQLSTLQCFSLGCVMCTTSELPQQLAQPMQNNVYMHVYACDQCISCFWKHRCMNYNMYSRIASIKSRNMSASWAMMSESPID